MVKNLPANAGVTGLVLGLGTSPGVGNGNPLQYSCLENSMDRGAWRGASPQGSQKSQPQLSTHTQDSDHIQVQILSITILIHRQLNINLNHRTIFVSLSPLQNESVQSFIYTHSILELSPSHLFHSFLSGIHILIMVVL